MSDARIAIMLDRYEDLSLLPMAEQLRARCGTPPRLAAVGREAREALTEFGVEHDSPDSSDWFFLENHLHLVVMALLPPERGGLQRYVAREAARRGIPCLAVEIDPGRPGFDPFPAYLAVAGTASHQRALQAGWNEAEIAVTGSPAFDLAASGAPAMRNVGSPDNERSRCVLVASRFGRADARAREAFARSLGEAAREHSSLRFEIAERFAWQSTPGAGDELVRHAPQLAGRITALAGWRWRERVLAVDAVITDEMGVALFAAASAVPLIAIDWPTPPAAPGERTRPLSITEQISLPPARIARPDGAADALRALLAAGRSLPGAGLDDNARGELAALLDLGPPSAGEQVGFLAAELAAGRAEREAQATRHVSEGNRALGREQLHAAEREYEAALQKDPSSLVALGNLGVLLAERGAEKKAQSVLRRLLAFHPGDAAARLTLARLLARAGDHFAAAEQIEQVLERDPQNRTALLLLGEVYLDGGLPEQASGLFERAAQFGALDDELALERERAMHLSAGGGATSRSALPLSIVIVAYNSAEDLPACLDSIEQATATPHEVIVVDNASSDATRALLRSRRDVVLVESDENIGYSRAANVGLARARGEAVVLLNPDTVVTPGWAERMLAHVAPGVGAVGPLSNYVAGQQKFEMHLGLAPGKITLQELVGVLARKNAGRSVATKLLIGFCLLITREALDRAGGLDEELFLGNDDLEYSLRLRRLGLTLLIATDAFVFHKGQKSFQSEPSEKTARLVEESTNRLQEKLEALYGAESVPTPQELWGIGWFAPTRRTGAPSGPGGEASLTSIVIVTWNELEYTKKCVAALGAHTPEPHEIIFVDNGSTDGTPDWLATVPRARVIRNDENRGFAAGANQGIRAARGEKILLLNNDVVVSGGWLSGLAAHLEASPANGMVGPISNYVSGDQLDRSARYDSMEAMAAHARRVAQERRGDADETRRLVGFCLLARAEVFRGVGLFDEGFGLGNFEDDDLSMRAVLAGWRLLIARDVFVHHFGSRTFAGNQVDYRASLEKNKAYFLEKWNGVAAPASATSSRASSSTRSG